MGCPLDRACLVACLFGDESQQPMWPQVMHSRRWTHHAPMRKQSSQPSADGVTSRIWSIWVHTTWGLIGQPYDASPLDKIDCVQGATLPAQHAFGELESYRSELTAYCYRMLGSPFDAEDAVQDTFVRAWRNREQFEGRSAMRSWLYRIATNVCLDTLKGKERRTRPMDLGPSSEPIEANLNVPAEITWLEPVPLHLIAPERDPADVAVANESVRLAFVAALQHLPARQRAVLILREVLDWQASEVAELLDASVASVNSALQRARATLAKTNVEGDDHTKTLSDSDHAMLERYVAAFERYDLNALTSLIQEDARQSMPPYDMWLAGRDDIMRWWFGPGIGCKGSRVIPTMSANGMPTFAQYKPSPTGGYDPWALQVLQLKDGRISEFTFFLDTAKLFPLFGMPLHLDA
jgi:RNA polymerase sigma-70 factor, ECF subfamily